LILCLSSAVTLTWEGKREPPHNFIRSRKKKEGGGEKWRPWGSNQLPQVRSRGKVGGKKEGKVVPHLILQVLLKTRKQKKRKGPKEKKKRGRGGTTRRRALCPLPQARIFEVGKEREEGKGKGKRGEKRGKKRGKFNCRVGDVVGFPSISSDHGQKKGHPGKKEKKKEVTSWASIILRPRWQEEERRKEKRKRRGTQRLVRSCESRHTDIRAAENSKKGKRKGKRGKEGM